MGRERERQRENVSNLISLKLVTIKAFYAIDFLTKPAHG